MVSIWVQSSRARIRIRVAPTPTREARRQAVPPAGMMHFSSFLRAKTMRTRNISQGRPRGHRPCKAASKHTTTQ